MSIIGDPSADVVISQQMWINITSEAERLAAMAKECAAERDALRAEVERLRADRDRLDWMERWLTGRVFPGEIYYSITFTAGMTVRDQMDRWRDAESRLSSPHDRGTEVSKPDDFFFQRRPVLQRTSAIRRVASGDPNGQAGRLDQGREVRSVAHDAAIEGQR